ATYPSRSRAAPTWRSRPLCRRRCFCAWRSSAASGTPPPTTSGPPASRHPRKPPCCNCRPECRCCTSSTPARAADGTILDVSESIWRAEHVVVIDEYPIDQHPEQPPAPSSGLTRQEGHVTGRPEPTDTHPATLRNHWYWRPGWRPGRHFYTWH